MNSNLNAVEHAPENAVRGHDGKPILFERLGDLNRCIALVNEYLDYELVQNYINDNCICMIPDPSFPQRTLSILDRASIAALAWHCREYGAGLKRGESITMPIVGASANDIDCAFQDEGRAYMFAQAVEVVFERNALVVGVPFGWMVTVGSSDVTLDGEMLAQLRGVYRVLMSYPLGDYDDVLCGNSSHEIYPDPEARRAWQERKSAQASRIEQKLDTLLARLDAHSDPHRATNAAKGKPAPTAVDVFAESANGDKHRLPERSRKPGKSSAKSK